MLCEPRFFPLLCCVGLDRRQIRLLPKVEPASLTPDISGYRGAAARADPLALPRLTAKLSRFEPLGCRPCLTGCPEYGATSTRQRKSTRRRCCRTSKMVMVATPRPRMVMWGHLRVIEETALARSVCRACRRSSSGRSQSRSSRGARSSESGPRACRRLGPVGDPACAAAPGLQCVLEQLAERRIALDDRTVGPDQALLRLAPGRHEAVASLGLGEIEGGVGGSVELV